MHSRPMREAGATKHVFAEARASHYRGEPGSVVANVASVDLRRRHLVFGWGQHAHCIHRSLWGVVFTITGGV
jgi:hypothetical protein